jgi:hypothetical protein
MTPEELRKRRRERPDKVSAKQWEITKAEIDAECRLREWERLIQYIESKPPPRQRNWFQRFFLG